MSILKSTLEKHLTQNPDLSIINSPELNQNIKDLTRQIEKTVQNSQSSTTLITGLPGVGKNLILEHCLQNCIETVKSRNEVEHQQIGLPTIVRLDGSVETDDRRSVVSIASQIGMPSGLEDEDQDSSQAIEPKKLDLSHLQINSDEENKENVKEKPSVDKMTRANYEQDLASTKLYDAMDCVLNALKSTSNISSHSSSKEIKKVIIILERFEKIANRKMQILLYNLLDLARDGSLALCLIGMTTVSEIDSLLEKRVKSRFASRKNITITRNYGDEINFERYVSDLLTFRQITLVPKKQIESWNHKVSKLVSPTTKIEIKALKEFKLFFLPQINDPNQINRLFLLSVMNLDKDISEPNVTLTWRHIRKTADDLLVNSPNPLDNGLSNTILQLINLPILQSTSAACICNVSERHPDKGINFEMVYREIESRKLKNSNNLCNNSKILHLKAFQKLIEYGLLLPLKAADRNSMENIGSSLISSNEMFEYAKFHSLFDRTDLEAAFQRSEDVPDNVRVLVSSHVSLFA